MRAAQVIDFRARERIALRFEQEEKSQLARFIARIGHDRETVVRDVNAAAAVNDFVIDSDARSHFELIADPEAAARRAGATLSNGVVDLRPETCAFDRREVLRLGDENACERQR